MQPHSLNSVSTSSKIPASTDKIPAYSEVHSPTSQDQRRQVTARRDLDREQRWRVKGSAGGSGVQGEVAGGEERVWSGGMFSERMWSRGEGGSRVGDCDA